MATSSRPPSVIRQQGRRNLQRSTANSMVASAAVLSGAYATNAKVGLEGWQQQAFDYLRTTGELRFGVSWIANALSRVNLVAAIPPKTQGDEPTPIDLATMPAFADHVGLVEAIAGGPSGQGQMLASVARQTTVAGVGYILAGADDTTDTFSTWQVLSYAEVRRANDGAIEYTDATSGDWLPLGDSDVLVKVWNADAERRHLADSPVHGVFDSLAEIRILSKRVMADALSRLVNAGLLVLPQSVEFPVGQGQNGEMVDEFVETLMQVAQVAPDDPSSPAARVPVTIKVPDDAVDKVQWIELWSQFDASLVMLRDAAIKRLAIGLDMPPEVLLGMGDSNHWSAWQIAEEAITMHIEPLAELVCHALTTGFLWPMLDAMNLPRDSVMVWYDTSDLAARPNLAQQAEDAYALGLMTPEAYMNYKGLDAANLPTPADRFIWLMVDLAVKIPMMAPQFLAMAGLIPEDDAAAADPGAPAPDPADPDAAPADGPPAEPADPGEAPDAQAAALLAAADGIVHRALERAGSLLRNAAGRTTPGGNAAFTGADPTTLHCAVAATEHASLDALLRNAWDRVPTIATRYGVDAESLTSVLDGYARGLIAARHEHTVERLAGALGVVDARSLVTA